MHRNVKASVTLLVVAKQFRCHVWTIGRLKNRFQQIGTASHRPRPRRRRMWTRRQDRDIKTSHLCNRFHMESVTARTSKGTHNPKIRAQTVRNRFKSLFKTPTSQRLTELYFGAVFTSIKEPAVVPTS